MVNVILPAMLSPAIACITGCDALDLLRRTVIFCSVSAPPGLEQRVAPLDEPRPLSDRHASSRRSGLVSLNAHYRLRVPFSPDHVHLLAHPVWVVVMRAGVRSATKERPSPYRNLRVDGPPRPAGAVAGVAPNVEQPRPPATRLS